MVPFQAARWDDPEKLFGSQGFRLSVDPESQMAIFFANAERKDLFQMQETAGNILPLLVVDRFDVAPVVLRLLDGLIWIVKQGFSRRGPGENLPADVGGRFPVNVAGVVSEEAEHQDRSTHERLRKMLIGCANDVDFQPGTAGITDRTDPSAVDDVAENVECSALGRIAGDLSGVTVNLQDSGVHHHSGEVLGMVVYSNERSHVEGTAILAGTAVDI